MPQYKFHCSKCKNTYEAIVKMAQEYDKCPNCRGVAKRTHCDLPSPPNLVAGVGGYFKPSYGTREVE